jgi:hypothetical protein
MGLAPNRGADNPEKNGYREVPVPIFYNLSGDHPGLALLP